jgi:uncharacterized protein (TIGR02285 family)
MLLRKAALAAWLMLAGVAATATGLVVERPPLNWLVQDLPPHFSFVNGRAPVTPQDLGHGEVDGFLRLLIERMPQYEHRFVDASFQRFELMVRQGQTLCSTLHVRTPERLSWLYFTHLHTPLLARQIHVIVHRDRLAHFEAEGQGLQLGTLLKRKDLVGRVARDRSFGPRIDALLRAHPRSAPRAVSGRRTMNLLAMLRARRMDYTLEYPSVVEEYLRSVDAGAELVTLPVAEGRSTPVATAACSRNPEGRQAIQALDLAVRQLAQDPQREAWVRSWRGDALEEHDRQRLNRYMDERARGGPRIE